MRSKPLAIFILTGALVAVFLLGPKEAIPTRAEPKAAPGDVQLFFPFVSRGIATSLLPNGDFESGNMYWRRYFNAYVIQSPPSHSGSWHVYLGYPGFHFSPAWIEQDVFVPPDKPYLYFWDIAEPRDSACGTQVFAYVSVGYREYYETDGVFPMADFCTGHSNYQKHVVDLTAYASKPIALYFFLVDEGPWATWSLDDIGFQDWPY